MKSAASAATGFGGSVLADPPGKRRTPKHPLAGNGPIVDRARRALRMVAEEFGTVTDTDQTSVRVRTEDGIPLTLSYQPGNYLFSRVYGLTVSTRLPQGCGAPNGVKLAHRSRPGGVFVPERGASTSTSAVERLNDATEPHLTRIDTVSARISERTLTLTPMGGSYVWVLIPPVFKATAFPKGEPRRIIELIRAVRSLPSG